ncbi:cation diffusion facilitator family transporter [Bacteroidota bacterium]
MEKNNHNHKVRKRHQHQPVNDKNLLVATLLNLVVTIAELAGGIVSNSLALLSDALHNLSDTFATFIAYLASRISKKEANPKKTFGYKRVEILAAMLNAVILIVICIYLFKEAYERIQNPEPINTMIVIVVAMIGLIGNVLSVAILRKDSKKNINVKAAYVHLIGDSLSSVVVIIAAVSIQIFELLWIDPIITVLIGIYLIREGFVILKETVNILMQATPENIDLDKIKIKVEALDEVYNIHHMHAWNLTDHEIHFEAHVDLSADYKLSAVKPVQNKIEKLLKSRFRIHHITLQFEYDSRHSGKVISEE